MPTITLTDEQFAMVKQAVEVANDMNNDMCLENMSVDIFPRGDKATVLTEENAAVLRKEIEDAINDTIARTKLNAIFGIETNEKGYCI